MNSGGMMLMKLAFEGGQSVLWKYRSYNLIWEKPKKLNILPWEAQRRQMKHHAFKREIKDEKTLSYTAIPRRWVFL